MVDVAAGAPALRGFRSSTKTFNSGNDSDGRVVLVTIAWTIFLFRRRAMKKRDWVEPDRWYDDTHGY
jgi:hypothetical protein